MIQFQSLTNQPQQALTLFQGVIQIPLLLVQALLLLQAVQVMTVSQRAREVRVSAVMGGMIPLQRLAQQWMPRAIRFLVVWAMTALVLVKANSPLPVVAAQIQLRSPINLQQAVHIQFRVAMRITSHWAPALRLFMVDQAMIPL